MLVARGIEKNYGDVSALVGADLDVAEGQIVSLLGRNGAGKTTLLSVIAGLIAPDAGSVQIGGMDAFAKPRSVASLVGIAPQATGVYPVLTVRQNLEFFGELAGLDRRARARRASEVAERLGLSDLLDRMGGKLSGGETRRLHTACALVHTPKLLMLDEPTVGADVATRAQLIEAVRELADEGAAIVYTTHYMPEVEALEAEIVIIDKGAVRATGTQAELIASHSLRGVRFQTDGFVPAPTMGFEPERVATDTYRVLGDIEMPDLLDHLGPDAGRLVSVEALRPDLETVFLAATGRRLDAEGGEV
ncbi:MAG: ABC transporter ATP-binding protein [Actinomycetia bacterium]|nr:ABC transporter ATP-binding protein [Actinomycetes bacterium]MCP4960515.1 ABC transporter ATP-binding protein [Actinomycetes bacterium]